MLLRSLVSPQARRQQGPGHVAAAEKPGLVPDHALLTCLKGLWKTEASLTMWSEKFKRVSGKLTACSAWQVTVQCHEWPSPRLPQRETPPGNTTGEAGEARHYRQPRSATQATLFLKINSDGSSSVGRKLLTIQTKVKTIKNMLKVKKNVQARI